MPEAFPAPDAPALDASRALVQRIEADIAAAGGWIGFDRYMQMALYEPGLGYYSGGSRKFGADGDFVTAPELTPLFGECLAAQCAQWFAHCPAELLEFGAGSGALAAHLLVALAAIGAAPLRYRIVELSSELRERQRRTLAEQAPALLGRVEWLDALPPRIEGVVLANEVLDAMPVRLFVLRHGSVLERGVVRAPAGGGLAFDDRPADAAFSQRVGEALDQAWSEGFGDRLGGMRAGEMQAGDYVSELGEQAQAWVETVGSRLQRGAMLLIDYGFPRAEYYHPERSMGTLMCHYRHRAHTDPFLWPGLQDITAHVDFTALHRAARRAGLDTLGYTSQARLLLDCGLLDRLAALPRDDPRAWTLQSRSVGRLLSEAEMGELFKAVAFARNVPDDALGFATRDRRGALD